MTLNCNEFPLRNMKEIRKAVITDLDSIMKIEEACFTVDGFSRRQFRSLITGPSSKVFILTENDKPIGHCVTILSKLVNKTIKGRVYSLAVTPDKQGQGNGKLMLEHVEWYFRRKDATYITLECEADNARLVTFYKHRGYVVTARLHEYYSGGSDAFRMRKDT